MNENESGGTATTEAGAATQNSSPTSASESAPGESASGATAEIESPAIEQSAAGAPSAASAAQAEATRRAAFEAATKGTPFQRPQAAEEEQSQEERGSDGRFAARTPGLTPTIVKPPGVENARQNGQPGQNGKAATDKRNDLPPLVQAGERAEQVAAVRALRRDGWTQDEIEAIPAERLFVVSERIQQRQAADDGLRRRLGNLESQIKRLGGNANGETSGNGVASFDGSAPPRSGARDRLDSFLDEMDGGETGNEQPQRPAPNGDLSQLQAQANALRGEVIGSRLQISREAVFTDFPQLADAKVMAAVQQQMDRLDPGGHDGLSGVESLTRLMRDAAYIVLGPQLKEQAKERQRQRNHEARNGQPDTATVNRTPAGKTDPESIRRAAYKAATTSASAEEARSKVNIALGRPKS